MKKSLFLVLILLFCGFAAALFLYSTPFGVGLTNDSSAYIGGARSLLEGRGYVRIGGDGLPRAITHFPPFYSIILACFSKITGQDPLAAAKIVNLCCSVLNQLLFMTALLILTGSRTTAVIGGFSFLCAGPVLQANCYGLSEALYLTLFLCIFILSVKTARNGKTGVWALIGLLTGALVLTRYAGLAVFGASLVYILCVVPAVRQRILGILLYLAGFALPVGFWLMNENRNGGSAVNRTVSLHLPAADKVEEGIRNIAGFFLPEFGGFVDRLLKFWGIVIAGGLLFLLAAAIYMGIRSFLHPSDALAKDPLFAPILHSAAYMVTVILTVCFIDGSTLFDNRILLPFYVCMLLLIHAVFSAFLDRKRFRIFAIAVMVGFIALLFEDELDLIREYHRNGQGFAGEEWRESETRLAALNIPEGKLLFSNRQTALSLLNDQPSYILPPMFDSASNSGRESFETDRKWMDDEVLSGNAYVVVFNYQEMMEDDGDREWLDTVLEGLPVYSEYSDGIIFGK